MKKEEKIKALQDIVRIKSVNDKEEEVAKYIQKLFKDHGIESELVEYAPGRSNLVAILEGSQAGKTLAISGHMDVVSAGDESEWTYPPFSGEIVDGKLYGRGSTDMKGGTIGLAIAMIELKESGQDFKGKIKYMATVGEEIGTVGAKFLTQKGYADDLDGLLIGEPSGPSMIVSTHKGSMSYKVTSVGKSSHSSMPEEGINAINQLNLFITKANARMQEITDKYENEKTGRTTHAITIIQGGTQINSIPEKAVLEGNIRSIAEYPNDKIEADLHQIIDEINQEIEGHLSIELTQNNFPVDKDDQSDLVKAIQSVVGSDVPVSGIGPTTDGAQFIFGKSDFDFAIYGPGEPTLPHQVNEFIKVEEYLDFIDIYQKVYLAYLN
ncbi:ArgE/DapE family deacylase [Facklamia hominis]|uniref:Probable succinyl-diaminopimelate desuccinylase n=1 Tax=Facklamia hominis TaxID=178214 RepID=A0AAJ1V2C3_9LACT|nr:ArgE/DapE family deacylase [Facklamia hominis]MDK7187340.1 ArgE/DapE family deacylase [Facklamia hominis]